MHATEGALLQMEAGPSVYRVVLDTHQRVIVLLGDAATPFEKLASFQRLTAHCIHQLF